MATQTSKPFGLKPLRPLGESEWNGKVRPYYIASTYATDVFIGDPIIWTNASNTGTLTAIGGVFNPGTLPSCQVATAGSGNKITGVVTGFMPTDRSSNVYGPASTDRIAYVCEHPWMIYLVQADNGAVLTTSTVGHDAVLIAGTGSKNTGLSGWMMDSGTSTAPAANSAYQLSIIGLHNAPATSASNFNSDISQTYAVWEVFLRNPSFAFGVAGV